MTLKKRIILSIPLVIIFAIVGAIIILYSQGYRYDFKRKKFTKTGVLFINSSPENALIKLNNKPLEIAWYDKILFYKRLFKVTQLRGPTPTTINNLIPDQYEVVVEKEGYQKWKKKLDIEAEKITLVPMLQLFLKNPEIKLIQKANISNFWLAPNKKRMVYLVKNKLFNLKEFDIINKKESEILKTYSKINKINWSKSNNKILVIFSGRASPIVINFKNKNQIIYLKNLAGLDENKIKWDRVDSNLIWFQKENYIYSLDLFENRIKVRFGLPVIKEKGEIEDWLIGDEYIFWLRNLKDDFFLEAAPIYDNIKKYKKNSVILKIKIPEKNVQLKKLINSFLILSGKNNIYIIDLKEEKNKLTKIEGNNIIKNKKMDNFLVQENFSLSVLKPNKNKIGKKFIPNIICRFSQQISQADWFADTDYIIYSIKNQIWATETDQRDKINRYLLLKPNILKYFWVDEKTKSLFFIGKIDNNQGIFQVKIQ